MKIKVILFFNLICMHFGALQAGPMFSKEPIIEIRSCVAAERHNSNSACAQSEPTLEKIFKKNIIYDGVHSQIMIVRASDLYEHVRNSSQAKIYSSDDAIQQFVFKNCVKNFERAINYEIKDITFLNNFHDIISVMDIFHLMRESQGSSTNHVQALCNGEYTGFMPLHFAVKHHEYIDMAKVLIEYGADVNAVDKDKYTPLMLVSQRLMSSGCGVNMFELLLQHGADINKKSFYDKSVKEHVTLLDTAVYLCFYMNDHRYLVFLLKHGADVDAALPSTKDRLMRSRFCNLIPEQKSKKS